MGRRVHVISKREEYGNTSAFNWSYKDFADLLSTLECGVYEEENEEGLSRFEMLKEDYKNALDKLKNLDSLDEDEREDIQDALSDFDDGYDLDYIIKTMESFLQECDKESDYIIFSVW